MTFKEALIAHLQGKKVQARLPDSDTSGDWDDFVDKNGSWNYNDDWKLCLLNGDFDGYAWEFRIAPRTILVNGVEVPAPEKDAPADGAEYFVPQFLDIGAYEALYWKQDELDARLLERGLVYLDKASAIARAKAMLITQEVK
jgi:hypothetical protein